MPATNAPSASDKPAREVSQAVPKQITTIPGRIIHGSGAHHLMRKGDDHPGADQNDRHCHHRLGDDPCQRGLEPAVVPASRGSKNIIGTTLRSCKINTPTAIRP
jgi:hypothetical protein